MLFLLITIYKAFVRPHLDYGDILYDQAYNASFHQKLEKIQYNVCIAITGAVRGTSKEKIHQEVGLESLETRRHHTLQEIQTKFLFLKLTRTFTKIRFSRVLLLNGIISIMTLGIL